MLVFFVLGSSSSSSSVGLIVANISISIGVCIGVGVRGKMLCQMARRLVVGLRSML